MHHVKAPIGKVLEYFIPSSAPSEEEIDRRTYNRISQKYPGYIPVIVTGVNINFLRSRFIIKPETTVAKFIMELRLHAPLLKGSEAMFIYIDDTLPPIQSTMGDLYYRYRSVNRFLYIEAAKENTFG